MTELGLTLPSAFNYHFDNDVFGGLGICELHHSRGDFHGYRTHESHGAPREEIEVEYRKMLPVAERDKWERRGQLHEQHQPIAIPLRNHGSAQHHLPLFCID